MKHADIQKLHDAGSITGARRGGNNYSRHKTAQTFSETIPSFHVPKSFTRKANNENTNSEPSVPCLVFFPKLWVLDI